tara:strand:+ start:3022 stop:4077 length:1056 start_codon:yes stop_codon:yes gene_type:complete
MAYTDIDDPSAHFQVTEYTGDGNTGRTVTNGGNSDLHPDIVWIKYRSAGVSHVWYDSSRGTTKRLYRDFNSTEATQPEGVQAFSSDGFTLGNAGASNQNTIPYVAWQWHMNAGSTSSNTDGSTTSTVQVNSDAGMSIVQYTGNGTDGTTVGHGLGAKPALIIGKSIAGAYSWQVRHHATGKYTQAYYSWPWDSTAGANSATSIWTNTEPTTSVFSLGSGAVTNRSGYSQIAYCFVEKKGFSKFGTYRGNGNTDGTFVYTGFKPAYVEIKTTSQNWHVWDSARNPLNVSNKYIASSTSAAEYTSGGNIDILSNGFKLRATDGAWNGSGTDYIYSAFAENPFVTSTGIPTVAR